MPDSNTLNQADELLAELRQLDRQNRQMRKRGALGDKALQADRVRSLNLQAKAIYGVDNRLDICDVTDAAVLRNVRATAALVGIEHMMYSEDRWVMRTVRFGDAYRLCAGQTFEEQPIAPHCSGFLVAPDIIATAGHCIETDDDVMKVLFVFGFEVVAEGADRRPRTVFEDHEVYRGAELIDRIYTQAGADWALVRLDREVPDREPLPVRREGKIDDGHGVYVIGHPCGLPKKYAPDANVVDNRFQAHFEATLDTFGGNSGSPVFNAASHEVEGILVRGQTDFWTTSAGCRVASTFPSTGTGGESVCRATEFAELLPDTCEDPEAEDEDTLDEPIGDAEQ